MQILSPGLAGFFIVIKQFYNQISKFSKFLFYSQLSVMIWWNWALIIFLFKCEFWVKWSIFNRTRVLTSRATMCGWTSRRVESLTCRWEPWSNSATPDRSRFWMMKPRYVHRRAGTSSLTLTLTLTLVTCVHGHRYRGPSDSLRVPPRSRRNTGSLLRMPPTSSPCTRPPSTGWRTWSAWATWTKPASSATCSSATTSASSTLVPLVTTGVTAQMWHRCLEQVQSFQWLSSFFIRLYIKAAESINRSQVRFLSG